MAETTFALSSITIKINAKHAATNGAMVPSSWRHGCTLHRLCAAHIKLQSDDVLAHYEILFYHFTN
jgi:hypothetical protein